ncbi:MAG: hypothetical protein EAZ55_07640 [Cytophagales bacterium]|nr:MAG: hypothetical protein EAZ55_07640 [Cytophagales bacterium]
MNELLIDPIFYYERMRQDGIIMAYNGAVSQGILVDLGVTLQSKSQDSSETIRRRLFSIFIELAQNILLHSQERYFSSVENKDIGMGIILVKRDENSFTIISGNRAERQAADKIKQKCEYLNTLGREELKAFYKQERQKPHDQGKSGGNIGLIDMMRKSESPIVVEIKETKDKELVFMCLHVTVQLNSF